MTPTTAPPISPPLMTAEEFIKHHGDDSDCSPDECLFSYDLSVKERPPLDFLREYAPEIRVVVRSRTDRNSDVLMKVGQYLGSGVTVVVVLDPNLEMAAVYRESDGFPQRFSNGDELTLPDVLPGFSVPVKKFFE
jgi:Uma2 family endonuclease